MSRTISVFLNLTKFFIRFVNKWTFLKYVFLSECSINDLILTDLSLNIKLKKLISLAFYLDSSLLISLYSLIACPFSPNKPYSFKILKEFNESDKPWAKRLFFKYFVISIIMTRTSYASWSSCLFSLNISFCLNNSSSIVVCLVRSWKSFSFINYDVVFKVWLRELNRDLKRTFTCSDLLMLKDDD